MTNSILIPAHLLPTVKEFSKASDEHTAQITATVLEFEAVRDKCNIQIAAIKESYQAKIDKFNQAMWDNRVVLRGEVFDLSAQFIDHGHAYLILKDSESAPKGTILN